MQKDYCEILLTAIDMMQQSAELSRATITSDVQVNVDIDKLLPSANPLEDMLQHEAASYQNDITLAAGEATMMFTWMLHSQSRYDRLGIKTLITTDKQATQGSYGIQLTVYSSSKVYTVQLDSSDMLGDIFNFSDMLQKKIFDLTGASNIQAIKIQCYNNTNGTVTFSNTQVAIGYLLEQYGPNSEPLVLYVDGDDKKETNLTYTTSGGEVIENSEITLCVRWIYQDGVSYRAVTHHNFEDFPKGCSIRWYRYTPDNSGGDQYGGSYWQHIPLGMNENPFKRTLNGFDPSAENEQFKVVVLQGSLAGGIAATSSNIVKITNIISGAVEILTNRKILFDDGTNGIYPWYAFDDILAEDYLYEATTKRTLHLSYNSKLSNDDTLQKIQKITWKLPSEFMYYIADTSDEVVEEDGYTIITHNYENAKKPESLDSIFITYTIACEIAGVATAKVQCIFTMDDNIEYIFEHEINFSHTLGGTDNSVIVRLLDASGEIHSAIDINNTIEYYVFPTVYNIDGTPIEGATYSAQLIITDFTEDNVKEKTLPVFKGDNGAAFTLPKENGLFSLKSLAFIKFIFTIPKGAASGNEDVKFNGELQVEEWFGLPITTLGSYVYKGPKRIVYNSSGVDPQYNKTNLQVVNDNSTTQTWTAVGSGKYNKNAEEPEIIDDYFKTHNELFPIVKGNIIRPCHAFDKIIGTGISYFGVYCANKWLQPIVIYQNRYFSRIINDWDGSLQIDENGNYILSSAYVAGGKDEQNTFTGLIMGELGTISDEISDKKLNSTETGLFGYNKGAQSFGFRTNGSAFLGESGGGRINFDGNQGIIYSGNFDGFPKIKDEEGNEGAENDTSVPSGKVSIGTQGTYLNLKDGLFITSNGNFRGKITALEGDIAGWIIGEKALYKELIHEDETLYTGLGVYGNHTVEDLTDFILKKIKENETDEYYIITGYKNKQVQELVIPSKINNIPVKVIGDEAFINYQQLTKIVVSPGIQKIGNRAFYNCNSLTYIFLPASVSEIGNEAYYFNHDLLIAFSFETEDWKAKEKDSWINTKYYDNFGFAYGIPSASQGVQDNLVLEMDENILTENLKAPRFYAGAKTNPPVLDAITGRPNAKFLVTADGTLYAEGVEIQGKATIGSGKIGEWNIGTVPRYLIDKIGSEEDSIYKNALYTSNVDNNVNQGIQKTLILTPYYDDGPDAITTIIKDRQGNYSKTFTLGYDGEVTMTKGTMSGVTITEGTIGAWKLGTVPRAYVSVEGSGLGSAFNNALYSTSFASTQNKGQDGYTTILRPSGASTDWAFVIFRKEKTGVNMYHEVFGVKHGGKIFAKNAELDIQNGSIGPLKITANALTVTDSAEGSIGTKITNSTIDTNKVVSNTFIIDSEIAKAAYNATVVKEIIGQSPNQIWLDASSYRNSSSGPSEAYAVSIGSSGITLWRQETAEVDMEPIKPISWKAFFDSFPTET